MHLRNNAHAEGIFSAGITIVLNLRTEVWLKATKSNSIWIGTSHMHKMDAYALKWVSLTKVPMLLKPCVCLERSVAELGSHREQAWLKSLLKSSKYLILTMNKGKILNDVSLGRQCINAFNIACRLDTVFGQQWFRDVFNYALEAAYESCWLEEQWCHSTPHAIGCRQHQMATALE